MRTLHTVAQATACTDAIKQEAAQGRLDLACTSLSSAALAHLAPAVAAAGATEVDVSANPVGDHGLLALACALFPPSLPSRVRVLDLHAANLSDAGAVALAGILEEADRNSGLVALNLYANFVGEAGAAALVALLADHARLPALRAVNLGCNDVPGPVLEQVHAALEARGAVLELGPSPQSGIAREICVVS